MKEKNEISLLITNWGKFVSFVCIFIFYSTVLAYVGQFYFHWLILGFIVLIIALKLYKFVTFLFAYITKHLDFLGGILLLVLFAWFAALVAFSPPAGMEGRDEGSYANAAVYLAKNGSIFYHHSLLEYLNTEGPAHQALNFPGFVINNGRLTTQFSPGYSVWLAIFYLFTGSTAFWCIGNGFLVVGGIFAFYTLIRMLLPKWVALAGVITLLFHFVFIWFSRFTLSENLGFFLFMNLVLFLSYLRLNYDSKHFLPILSILGVFPLVRPEGWWFFLASFLVLGFWWRKKVFTLPKSFVTKISLILAGVAGVVVYILSFQFQVYRRLVRDWINWPTNTQHFINIKQGLASLDDIREILSSFFPSLEKFEYLMKVEWNYGVAFFGILILASLIFFSVKKYRDSVSPEVLVLASILFLLSFPFFIAFISPQISSDHPWMLRRFFFVILPSGILLSILLIWNVGNRLPKKVISPFISIAMACLLLPSLPATAYFFALQPSQGRYEMLGKLSELFSKNDWIFMNRDASGDGWQMWSAPLSSVYGLNSVFVYQADNVTNLKDQINQRWTEGKKTYVLIPPDAFDFEHKLRKNFNLLLEKEISFQNIQLNIDKTKGNTSFPQVENAEYKFRVYLLSPKS